MRARSRRPPPRPERPRRLVPRHDLHVLALVATLAIAALALALIYNLGVLIMRRLYLLAVLAAAALALAGCANLDALGRPGGVGQKVLDNLEGCDRHYQGALGAGVTGSFEINCKAQPAPVPASPPVSLKNIDQLLEPAT